LSKVRDFPKSVGYLAHLTARDTAQIKIELSNAERETFFLAVRHEAASQVVIVV
jgi:hypothetical protein